VLVRAVENKFRNIKATRKDKELKLKGIKRSSSKKRKVQDSEPRDLTKAPRGIKDIVADSAKDSRQQRINPSFAGLGLQPSSARSSDLMVMAQQAASSDEFHASPSLSLKSKVAPPQKKSRVSKKQAGKPRQERIRKSQPHESSSDDDSNEDESPWTEQQHLADQEKQRARLQPFVNKHVAFKQKFKLGTCTVLQVLGSDSEIVRAQGSKVLPGYAKIRSLNSKASAENRNWSFAPGHNVLIGQDGSTVFGTMQSALDSEFNVFYAYGQMLHPN